MPSQEDLQDAFNRTYGKPTPIRICQACCAGSKARTTCYEPGMVGKRKAARCNNCGHITVWTLREYPRHRGLTIGQERGIMRMRAALERHLCAGSVKLENFTIEEKWDQPHTNGAVVVSIRATRNDLPEANMLAMMDKVWITFMVHVRGALDLYSYYRGLSDSKHCAKMAGYLAASARAKCTVKP